MHAYPTGYYQYIFFTTLILHPSHNYIKSAVICHCLLHMLVSFGASMIYMDYYDKNKSQVL